ncbi:universal stress protein [Devriesea agamarum]|uniref:universal stress protein n=1 Tax=Devriesea agamarum TaxID=472569 RepID=UPI00071CBCD3|nr:universal stress protein [Devriesea agamarum]
MTVLVGFIPTQVGYAALDAAIAEADRRTTSLLILNVVHEGHEGDPRHARPQDLTYAEEKAREARVRYEIRQVTSSDNFAQVLIDTAERDDIELVVIGLRRDREVARHLLGATAQRVLLSAPCDVLAV